MGKGKKNKKGSTETKRSNEVQLKEKYGRSVSFNSLEANYGGGNCDLEAIYLRYKRESVDGGLNKEGFLRLLNMKETPFNERLFQLFDEDNTGHVTLPQVIRNLAPLHEKATIDEKVQFAERLYGADEGKLDKDQLIQILSEDLKQANVQVDKQYLEDAVDTLMDDHADEEGRLSVEMVMNAGNINVDKRIGLNLRGTMADVLKDEDLHQAYERDKREMEKSDHRHRQAFYRFRRYCKMHPNVVVFTVLYIIINALLFPAGLLTISSEELDFFGWGIIMAKCFRMLLYFNVFLVFLLMCRQTAGWLRRSKFLFKIIPFDSYITFHRCVGWVIALAALGHTIGHYKNFYELSNNPLDVVNGILKTPLSSPRSWAGLLFGIISGITGHIMIFCIVIIYACTFLRRKQFEVFWFTHQLWFVFIVCLLIHGWGKLITQPIFYIIFAFPGALFLLELMFRIVKAKHKTKVIEAKALQDQVTLLRVEKPKLLKPKPGQWVLINCRKIALFEWHPFTLTSAPHEDFLEVHVKAVGAWTESLFEHVKKNSLVSDETEDEEKGKKKKLYKFNVDGPFGAPAQNVDHYRTVVLFAAGIGVTPFAAVLKDMLNRMKSEKEYRVKKVYFAWTARSQKNFTWFRDVISAVEEYNGKSKTFRIDLYFTGATKEEDIRSVLLQSVINYHYSKKKECLVTGLGSRIHFSRPSLGPYLSGIAKENEDTEGEIGLFYCGPPALARMLAHECHRQRGKKTFKFHKENF
ncbi:dual oxidase [Planoprotostelium fungivorum]|uniref:Dual oxidase n=1 Tax=Planoprotostelium fungivorum TaxID=1890364 RepID=A0A2P6NC22_9EUKA|nr:dual oxidase [Planoprotostelium fungivorum]